MIPINDLLYECHVKKYLFKIPKLQVKLSKSDLAALCFDITNQAILFCSICSRRTAGIWCCKWGGIIVCQDHGSVGPVSA